MATEDLESQGNKPWLKEGETELINCTETLKRVLQNRWTVPMTEGEYFQFQRFCAHLSKSDDFGRPSFEMQTKWIEGTPYVSMRRLPA